MIFFYKFLFVSIFFMTQIFITDNVVAQDLEFNSEASSTYLTTEIIQKKLENHSYSDVLTIDSDDFENILILTSKKDNFLEFKDKNNLYRISIFCYENVEQCHENFLHLSDYGSNKGLILTSNFLFNQIGDVLHTTMKRQIRFCRGNIDVFIHLNGIYHQDVRSGFYKLASEIDRKICEVNGLPIPPVIETREELFKRDKEAKEQATKVNTNKSSLNNSDNSKTKLVVTEKREEVKSEVVSEPAKMLKSIWGVLGLLGIAIIGGMAWKIKSTQKPKE